MPDTVRLHRVLAMKREKVYRALIEPDPMVPTWQPGHFQAAPLWQPVVGWVDSAIERPLSATSLRGGSWAGSGLIADCRSSRLQTCRQLSR